MELTKLGARERSAIWSSFAMSERWLPLLLAVIAGMVDLTSFVGLGGIFTAHVTGNLVVLAAVAVQGGHLKLGQALALPMFIVTVSAAWLAARKLGGSNASAIRRILFAQFLLLVMVVAISVGGGAGQHPDGWAALAAVLLAASAMAAQNALLHLEISGAPSTAVMTGNLVSAVIFAFGAIANQTDAQARLHGVLSLLAGFLVGCSVAAAVLLMDRNWAWALPATLAGIVAVVPWRK